MAAMQPPICDFGWKAVDFSLTGIDGTVHTLDSVLEDPQLRDTGFLEERDHPSEGKYLAIQHPVKFSESPARIDRDPPLQGQDNKAVLADIGFSDSEIIKFAQAGVFGPKPGDLS